MKQKEEEEEKGKMAKTMTEKKAKQMIHRECGGKKCDKRKNTETSITNSDNKYNNKITALATTARHTHGHTHTHAHTHNHTHTNMYNTIKYSYVEMEHKRGISLSLSQHNTHSYIWV